MQKKFLSNLFLIILLNLLIKPVAIFGIDATVQNRVGADAYGIYFSLLNLSFLFNIILDLGINNFTTRNIAQNPSLAEHYWGKLIGIRLILFLAYAAITFGIAFVSGYSGQEFFMLSLLVLNQLLVTFIAFFRSHFGGLHLFKTDALISVMDRFLLILICGSLLYTDLGGSEFSIESYIWIQTICYGATLFLAIGLLVARTGVPRFSFSPTFSYAILRKSFSFALLVLLMMVYTRTDSVMLERLHKNGAYEAGVYAQGFRLLDAVFMFGMIFANLLLPIFSRMIKEKNEQIGALLSVSREMLLGGAIFMGFFCFSQGKEILSLIYTQEVNASVEPFGILMWVFSGMTISLIYGTFLTAAGELRTLNTIAGIGVLINIGLNLMLIPGYGAFGAALATLITQLAVAVAQIIAVHSKYPITLQWKTILSYGAFVLAMLLLSIVFRENEWFISIQFFGGLSLLFLFKIIDLRKMMNFLRLEK
jgi:O-antigen/teichoic acid export membrane protein